MFRTFLITWAALVALILLSYKFTATDSPADFRYLNPSGIHTLDPARMSWTQDFRVALNIWEGLTTRDPITTVPVAGAAHFPPEQSDDGRTFTFTIRDDARWSNGDAVSAADFVRAWRRAMEPGTAADYSVFFTDYIDGAANYVRWRQAGVTQLSTLLRANDPAKHELALREHCIELEARFAGVGIRALDDRTLQVRLARRCPYFLDLTASPVYLPVHHSIEQMRQAHGEYPLTPEGLWVYDPQWTKPNGGAKAYAGLVTNGPYQLADWNLRRRARLTLNPYYRDAAKIQCRTIDMLIYDNIDAALLAYESGHLDFLPSLDVPYEHEIARLSKSGERSDFHLCPVLATMFLNLNCASESINGQRNPFLDPRIRRAFALSIDKVALVEIVLGRGDRIADSFIPPNSIPGYESPQGLSYDLASARAFLDEAGAPDGRGLPPIQLLYTAADERLCQAMARMWEQNLGVDIELSAKESKTFADDKQNRRFMIAKGNWYADYNDPTTFLDILATGNGNNDCGYSNPAYDQLLAEARDESGRERRAKSLQQAEAIIVESDFPVIPILHFSLPVAIKPYVNGLNPNPRLWFSFQYVTVRR